MKTVQEYIQSLDTYQLITTYINNYVNAIDVDKEEEQTIDTFIESSLSHLAFQIKSIYNYIEKLKKAPIVPNKTILLSQIIDDYYEHIHTSIIPYDEFIHNGIFSEHYAYDFQDQAEILGYNIYETEFVKDYIYEIIAGVLYEASFFGYDQEDLPRARESLQQSIQEINDMDETHFTSWEDYCSENNITFEQDPKELELRSSSISENAELLAYQKEKELTKILYQMLQ